jgi:predicted metalloendopeptidase
VDPCVDFYQFACGGWRKANPIPPDQTRWGRFNELAERNRNVLHDILEQVKDPRPGRSPLEAQVGDYYAACMDESAIETLGTKPIDPILEGVDVIARSTTCSGGSARTTRPRSPRCSALAPPPTCTTPSRPSPASARAAWGFRIATTT